MLAENPTRGGGGVKRRNSSLSSPDEAGVLATTTDPVGDAGSDSADGSGAGTGVSMPPDQVGERAAPKDDASDGVTLGSVCFLITLTAPIRCAAGPLRPGPHTPGAAL